MAAYTFPRANIDIKDGSGGSTIVPQVKPLHLPFFFIQAEQGPTNTPVLGTLAQHQQIFGINTFDSTKPFYSHQTRFALQAMQSQQVYLIRVADSTVATANLVIQVTAQQAQIPQYKVDVLGAQILDANGAPQPQTDANGVAISQSGYTLTWSTRQLAANELFNHLEPVTTTSGSLTTVTYPILAAYGTSPGSAPNRSGFYFYTTQDSSPTIANAVDSQLYRFAPVQLAASNTGVASAITDIFTQNSNDVSLRSVATDPDTAQDVSLNGILQSNYQDADGNPLLNYQLFTYSDNVQTLGQAILAVSPELAGTDPFLINILNGLDTNNNPYEHILIEPSDIGNSSTVLYLAGGSDGATSNTAFENLVAAYVQGGDTALFEDLFRFPFTHFYDSGFTLQNKFALLTMLSLRDDINITLSTQSISDPPNTQSQDQSTGAALLSRARSYPESLLFGTPAMRVDIYQQCGILAGQFGYSGIVACTINRLITRCTYYNSTFIKGSPKGRPQSEVSIFKSINWTTASATQKQLNWDTALNTIGYADINVLFYSDLRSIYSDQTSLLSNSVFVDYLIFLKHLARQKWTYYAGRDGTPSKLFSVIQTDIDTSASLIFGTALPTKTVVSQTEADKQVGYATTVTISVVGDKPNRVWNIVIPVSSST